MPTKLYKYYSNKIALFTTQWTVLSQTASLSSKHKAYSFLLL